MAMEYRGGTFVYIFNSPVYLLEVEGYRHTSRVWTICVFITIKLFRNVVTMITGHYTHGQGPIDSCQGLAIY